MSFLRAARAARAGQSGIRRIPAAVAVVIVPVIIIVLAGLSLSCGNSNPTLSSAPNHLAYVSLPGQDSVLLLQIDGATGAITAGAQTPPVEDTSPTGLALLPSKKFLYVSNARQDTISIFSVANDGTLSLTGPATQAGNGPDVAIIDPAGQYLLVTNNYGSSSSRGDISVYSIDAGSGVLTEVTNSPFPANANPTEIVFTHTGEFVYVTNPGIGMVTGFAFCPPQRASEPQCAAANGNVLSTLPGSPVFSGSGAAALAVDAGDQYLYVVNPSASNPFPYVSTEGNISAFTIDSSTGDLSPILGSPFTSTAGTLPTAIAIDPTGQFLYAVTQGSSNSIWCFEITPTNGQLVPCAKSPFSLAAGGQFALFDPSGSFFYIGDEAGTGIEGYTYNPSTGFLNVIKGSPFSTKSAPGNLVLSE